MLNAIFFTVVYICQSKKDILYMKWYVGALHTITVSDMTTLVLVKKNKILVQNYQMCTNAFVTSPSFYLLYVAVPIYLPQVDPFLFAQFEDLKNNPTVNVSTEYKKLEPIGFIFVIFFALVLSIQIIGMLIHRSGHYTTY